MKRGANLQQKLCPSVFLFAKFFQFACNSTHNSLTQSGYSLTLSFLVYGLGRLLLDQATTGHVAPWALALARNVFSGDASTAELLSWIEVSNKRRAGVFLGKAILAQNRHRASYINFSSTAPPEQKKTIFIAKKDSTRLINPYD